MGHCSYVFVCIFWCVKTSLLKKRYLIPALEVEWWHTHTHTESLLLCYRCNINVHSYKWVIYTLSTSFLLTAAASNTLCRLRRHVDKQYVESLHVEWVGTTIISWSKFRHRQHVSTVCSGPLINLDPNPGNGEFLLNWVDLVHVDLWHLLSSLTEAASNFRIRHCSCQPFDSRSSACISLQIARIPHECMCYTVLKK